MMTFEDFLMRSQNILQLELASRDYDTFTSFIDFYNGFKASGKSFVPFVSGYNDDLLGSLEGDGLSCVGLSVRLMGKLTESDLRIRNHLGLVSCEEVVKDVGSYCMESPNAVKEHVLVALHIVVEGNRRGYVLFDPGYHVARPVVIMEDKRYPHTSWFVQSRTSSSLKEYCYDCPDDRFLTWTVKETRRGVVDQWSNLIYVKRAFEKSMTITQKRSLFYGFKSYVIRDRKGPIAGIYCWLRNHSVTIFYPMDGQKIQKKYPIDGSPQFTKDLEQVSDLIRRGQGKCAKSFLLDTLKQFKEIVLDLEFIESLYELDDWIEEEA